MQEETRPSVQDNYVEDDEESEEQLKEPTKQEKFEMLVPNRLDEGMCDTLCKEFKRMLIKFSYVLIPRDTTKHASEIRNWDLWGPFFICIVFGLFINNGDQFITLVYSVFGGGFIATFNIKVLGGKISYIQSVSILGYCIFPLFLAVLSLQLLLFLQLNSNVLRLCLIIIGTVWCMFAAKVFLAVKMKKDRKFVAIFPICVYYVLLAVILVFT